jgi:hypothetical protein
MSCRIHTIHGNFPSMYATELTAQQFAVSIVGAWEI